LRKEFQFFFETAEKFDSTFAHKVANLFDQLSPASPERKHFFASLFLLQFGTQHILAPYGAK
jgi:hypothetical protein